MNAIAEEEEENEADSPNKIIAPLKVSSFEEARRKKMR